jgi:hypothetical protein
MARAGVGSRNASAADSISRNVLQTMVSASLYGLFLSTVWIMDLRDSGLLPSLIQWSSPASMAGILGFSWIFTFFFKLPAQVNHHVLEIQNPIDFVSKLVPLQIKDDAWLSSFLFRR